MEREEVNTRTPSSKNITIFDFFFKELKIEVRDGCYIDKYSGKKNK